MAENRFRQYQYGLVRFFRIRGYEVNSIKKTIKIDAYNLNSKESERLLKLQTWGFTVINPHVRDINKAPIYECTTDYENDYDSESFLDFADRIIWMCKNESF